MILEGASEAYLRGRLALLEARVKRAVDTRRGTDPNPDDRFRGLYISDDDVDRLLAPGAQSGPSTDEGDGAESRNRIEREADVAEESGVDVRLRRLARSFKLDDFDIELLLIALAPDLDARFERLYAYLHDDVSRRRASAGLALELCRVGSSTRLSRSRFDPNGPLVGGGLLLIEDQDRPFLTRPLRVPDRVTAHLLGDDAPDPLVEVVTTQCVMAEIGPVDDLARALALGTPLFYLRERTGSAGQSLAATALARVGKEAIVVDLMRLTGGDNTPEIAAAAAREAMLIGGGLVAGPIDAIAENGAASVRAFAEARCPVLLIGQRVWDPGWARTVPFIIDAPVPDLADRAAIWKWALEEDAPDGFDGAADMAHFRLTPEQITRAAHAGRLHATASDRVLSGADLLAGARSQNSAGLERLSRRIEPKVAWEHLVLPERVLEHLNQLTGRARHRPRVMDDWGMGAQSSRGRGVTALFAGDSGTGKTMSAEVIAGDLGLDLYVIDLSTVIDKYIGETEKNLDRIFGEADRVNGVLLFDEADALFGKRSEVKDSHDRYANVEVAYLLQRMEMFDGLAILTTNLRSNLDEAFTRRLDAIIDFPMPEEDDRLRLWDQNFKPELPCEDDIDVPFLAKAFKLSGGNIRNITVTAAYLAATDNRSVSMADIIVGTEIEYQKLGRLCVEAEFGPYYKYLSTTEPEVEEQLPTEPPWKAKVQAIRGG